ncbi:CRISPR-associated protein Cas2 [Muribacter muris]|uniref:CRISPR-associated protein Cas2 n=1 Tax=Muribacter muris TaxID=67855 RepID=A0A4Y9JV18_9PAST|nr:CRISPR-associated protein Cas2 [Muribacter muris]MBF0785737.1 CRISPR-associated protein Cas2 [Muribacter muris]MBF0828291.1 CRISPR-associated protein Cas2 [Muribacter muris]TFV08560.1 CRISPR-associated protein Cas2 [Muribacter muris]
MKNYLISYDLNNFDKDYSDLIKAIKTYRSALKILDSVFVIQTSSSAFEITSYLKEYLDENDEIIATELTEDTAWILQGKKSDELARLFT